MAGSTFTALLIGMILASNATKTEIAITTGIISKRGAIDVLKTLKPILYLFLSYEPNEMRVSCLVFDFPHSALRLPNYSS